VEPPCSAPGDTSERRSGGAGQRRRRVASALLCAVLFVASTILGPAREAEAADPKKIQAKLDAISEQYGKIETDLANTEQKLAKLETDLSRADQVLKDKSDQMRARVGYIYRQASFGAYIEGLLTSEDPQMFIRRLEMLQIVGARDSEVVDAVVITKARGDDLRAQLEATRKKQRTLASSLQGKERELENELKQAKASAPAGGGTLRRSVAGFVFPVVGPSSFASTWGAPRSGGRRHKGNDIMAPCGARAVAVVDGTISGLGSHGRGGIMLWLTGRNGDEYFYAHMRGYASGVHVGRAVKAGELVAYVGNTGNARGGPCHIHWEYHPRGGAAMDPYRLLRSAT
jgi:murein DD-endopeptidase MepM/ murein hydrolase activator NlpD